MGLSRRFHHIYNDKDIPYDIWSNIHYGVIGSIVYNYNDEYILNGAGQAQRWSDNRDCNTLKQILDDYESGLKKGSENITAEQLLEIAVKQPVIDNKDLTDVEYK